MKEKAVMVWSGGKDSALTLHRLLNNRNFEVCHLLTSANSANQRVSMHGVHKSLMLEQAKSIGLPITFVEYEEASYSAYEDAMAQQISVFQKQGINTFAFGDIFLEDLKQYRENQLDKIGARAIFPLWKEDTRLLVKSFIDLGFKSMVCCIDAQKLNSQLLGKPIDNKWISNLGRGIDPCGENGEFHTFCFDGPLFDYPLRIQTRERLLKEYKHQGQVSQFEFVELGIL